MKNNDWNKLLKMPIDSNVMQFLHFLFIVNLFQLMLFEGHLDFLCSEIIDCRHEWMNWSAMLEHSSFLSHPTRRTSTRSNTTFPYAKSTWLVTAMKWTSTGRTFFGMLPEPFLWTLLSCGWTVPALALANQLVWATWNHLHHHKSNIDNSNWCY